MNEFYFNLATEPWVPVLPLGGGLARSVGLYELLTEAQTFAAIHDDSPLATVGLLRLCIALLYQALRGPLTKEEWRELWRAGRFPEDKLRAYFAEWDDREKRFDLFSETHPFFQTARLTMKEDAPLSRLATEAASGNNATVFDHRSDDAPPALTPAQAAVLLIAAQNFALGGGRTSAAIINGLTTERPNAADGICVRGITIFLTGDDLFQTLMLNLSPLKAEHPFDEDLPCWQHSDAVALMDAKDRPPQLARGVIDRYAWQSRMIRLKPETDGNGNVVVRSVFYTQGRSADKRGIVGLSDPMKAFVTIKAEGFIPVTLSAEKAAWRDVHGLLALSNADRIRPPVLENIAGLTESKFLPKETRYRLNMVGIATEPGKAAKVLMWRYDRMNLPSTLLTDETLLERLGLLIREAEDTMGEKATKTAPEKPPGVARQLWDRTRRLCKFYLAPESDNPDARQPDPKDVDKLASDIDPRPSYWARLERNFYELLDQLPADSEKASDEWRNAVEREALKSLKEACEALGFRSNSQSSVRAIKAMARIRLGVTCGDFEAAKARRLRTAQPPQPETLAEAMAEDAEEVTATQNPTSENGDMDNE